MKICSFSTEESNSRVGILAEDGIIDLSSADPMLNSFRSLVTAAQGQDLDDFVTSKLESTPTKKYSQGEATLKIPLTPSEVWAAGVTYIRSREAREVETTLKGLYNYVYDARRPEIFFKTTGIRCVGPEENVGIRSDSKWSVPEPELTVVFGEGGEIIGYTVGNDMSARDIEGENPLYLPQAKVFRACCSLGPVVATRKEIPDPRSLKISMTIERMRETAFSGSVSTSQLKRSIDELVSYLKSNNTIPPCSVFMTGTGIVPPDDFSLRDGDRITIEIDGIGKLSNMARVLT